MSAADWLSLPAADLPGHAGDWQIELLLLGGVMLRMNSTARCCPAQQGNI